MTTLTTSFNLPLLFSNQAQKDVTVNTALTAIDTMLQPTVISKALTLAPTSPSDQDKYIVASGATGVWAGEDNNLAVYKSNGATWDFYTPKTGWVVFNQADNILYYYNGSSWAVLTQTFSQGLSEINGLTPSLDHVIIGNGSNWVTTNLDAFTIVRALIFG